jgi:hypothetical protein
VTSGASIDDDDGQRSPLYQESWDSSSAEHDGDDDDDGDDDGDGVGGDDDGDGDGDDVGGGGGDGGGIRFTGIHMYIYTKCMMFLTICTNYDPWLTVGETEFTHAIQDRDHRAPESQRRTVGASQYDPTYSSSSYSDTSQSQSFYPIPDINARPQTTWVYEWEDLEFYNMLVDEWQTTSTWMGLTWQQYKGELLRTRGLNVMSIAEYHSATQMGIFPFYH